MSGVIKYFTRRVFVGTILISVVIGIPLGCAIAQEEVRIGVISPASGNYADYGASERRGMAMAVEEFNASGGVLGKKVKLVVEDSETDPSVATRKLRRLAEAEGIKFFMGGVSSSVAIAVGEVAQRYGVLFFATNQNSDTVTGKYAHRCVFRVPPNMAMALRAVGPYIVHNVGKKWYFMTHDYEWGWSGTRWGRAVLKKHGGTEVGESKVPLGTRDFSSFLLKARAAKPEVLVITVAGMDAVALREQIYEFGIYRDMEIVFTLLDWEDSWALGPEKSVGYIGSEWNHLLDAPGAQEFRERYKKRWPTAMIPEPTVDSYNGYIATRELLRAMERAGTTTEVTPVIKALEGHVIHDSLKHWPIKIREWDHQFISGFYLVREKSPEEMKHRTDFYEIITGTSGVKVARTREENPVQLELYPEE